MDFATRLGYREISADLHEEEMPQTLRAGLWDVAKLFFFENPCEYDIIGRIEGYNTYFDHITQKIWFHHFRKPVDDRGTDPRAAYNEIKMVFLNGNFLKIYSLLEFLAKLSLEEDTTSEWENEHLTFIEFINKILSREKSAFRFVNELFVKITNELELDELGASICDSPSIGIQKHIKRAAELYSQRPKPDFRNSIKESISAVESAVRFVTGEKSVGVSRPLKKVADEFNLHPALRDGFEKLYAYTSDESGIRHSILDEGTISQNDARYMLVSCSAFSNYLVALKTETQS